MIIEMGVAKKIQYITTLKKNKHTKNKHKSEKKSKNKLGNRNGIDSNSTPISEPPNQLSFIGKCMRVWEPLVNSKLYRNNNNNNLLNCCRL